MNGYLADLQVASKTDVKPRAEIRLQKEKLLCNILPGGAFERLIGLVQHAIFSFYTASKSHKDI